MIGERVYRALLLLYPRRFRREYTLLMMQLLRDARRDDTASWWRLTIDLLRSVPRQHREAIVHATPRTKLGVLAVLTTAAIFIFAVSGGAIAALVLMLVLAWVLASWLRHGDSTGSPGAWWKLSLTGVVLFATLFAVFAPPWPESWRASVDGDLAWAVGTIGFCLAVVLIVAGLLTGAVELSARRRLTR